VSTHQRGSNVVSRSDLRLARRLLVALAGAATCMCVASCQGAAASASSTPAQHQPTAPATSAAPVPPASVTISPTDGAAAVPLGSAVSVGVSGGTLASVTVTDADGDTVAGVAGANHTTWTTTGVLLPSSHYVVEATATDASGRPTVTSASFTTAAPSAVLGVKIAPLQNEVVGVGMPIVVYFDAAVTDKAAVESALDVEESEPVLGAWHWYGSKEVHYRPQAYWPVGEQVTLNANLRGVDAGKGIWGMADRTLNFTVGDSHISTVDATTHLMTVAVNGVVVKSIPVSTGRDKYPTTSGIHVVLDKEPSILMDSATVGIPKGNPDYYYETVAWDVRISWSGEFVHSAPWSVDQQGKENVSHGCVNASPADAEWFYNLSRRGDIVTITGTPRPLISGNGWTDWNMDWTAWVAGSALPAPTAPASEAPAGSASPAASAPASTGPTT
jgi:lipoprotein-anchoring transpeptidase ErfK/SrfK